MYEELPIPTAQDISTIPEDLDEQFALEHFLGKTIDQALELLNDNCLHYAEDFMWMGKNAFAYYFLAYCEFIDSEMASEDAGALLRFLGLIEWHGDVFGEERRPLTERVIASLDACIQNYERFDVNLPIDGDLKAKALTLRDVLAKSLSSS